MNLNTRLDPIERGDLQAFIGLVGENESLRNGPASASVFGSFLHYASHHGQLPIVKYLVENGADVNGRGGTFDAGPITFAASFGHRNVVEYLLSRGAKLDVSTPSRNPLFGAITEGRADIAKVLLDAGIDRHVVYRSVTGKLKNALSNASERGEKEIVDLLINAGCRLPVEGRDQPIWQPEEIQKESPHGETHQQIICRMTETFGTVDPLALQEIIPVDNEVHIAINVIRPSERHPFLTLFTTGMSDRPMKVPKGQESYQYAELVMHLPPTWPHPRDQGAGADSFWPLEWMRKLAYYPHLHDAWLGGPNTIVSSDEPPMPLGTNTRQTCLLLIADFGGCEPLVLGNSKTVRFYTVMPLYTEERDFETQCGVLALLQRLQKRGYTAVVNVNRANVALSG